MDLHKQVISGFQTLRKKRTTVGEPITTVSAKRVAIGECSSSERTMTEGNIHCHEVLPSRPKLSNSPPAGGSDMAGTFTPLSMYESHDSEAQLQLQLMSSTKVDNKVEKLKKRLEDADMELRTSRSLTNKLIGSEMYVVETAASEAEARHCSKIKTAKVTAVDEQKDKILKLRRKLASYGYNLCLKKMAKAYP
ncbi:hypothetical protein F0562_032479 [Nyssa sinensis]|uniref:Uncharacterized protein n=1 Tax=Nyssa sinensis TaxID=561372 RepID=A0A5J5ARI7_9ASTE|nr:hypothetical protein F0562_032479 [Nyssa sinensis]